LAFQTEIQAAKTAQISTIYPSPKQGYQTEAEWPQGHLQTQKGIKMLVINSFSVNMLSDMNATVSFSTLVEEGVTHYLSTRSLESAVGHADTAALFSTLLGLNISANRITVSLGKGDKAILGQYIGPRLPEGATTLPEGATVKWLLVEVV
jgi:hypothetical protein